MPHQSEAIHELVRLKAEKVRGPLFQIEFRDLEYPHIACFGGDLGHFAEHDAFRCGSHLIEIRMCSENLLKVGEFRNSPLQDAAAADVEAPLTQLALDGGKRVHGKLERILPAAGDDCRGLAHRHEFHEMEGAVRAGKRRIGKFQAFAEDHLWIVNGPCDSDRSRPAAVDTQAERGGAIWYHFSKLTEKVLNEFFMGLFWLRRLELPSAPDKRSRRRPCGRRTLIRRRVSWCGPTAVRARKTQTRFRAQNFSLLNLLTTAYKINHWQLSAEKLSGGREMFDVAATMAEGTTREQFEAMMQQLLAERFELKVHWEDKEMPLYELVVVKGGPRFKASQGKEEEAVDSNKPPVFGMPKLGVDGYPEVARGKSGMVDDE